MPALDSLAVLALDCQATGAQPAREHLLEIAWTSSDDRLSARLVKLPSGAELPERVRRVTGLSEEELALGVEPGEIWPLVATMAGGIAEQNRLPLCSTVVHFATFEARYLRWLHFRGAPDTRFPFHFLCTHRIARRLFPELPRKSLRAVAGYLGVGLPESRRAAEHARATLAVWRALVALLREREGVSTLDELFDWLRRPAPSLSRRRLYPMPAAARGELPPRPGIYRMLRANGDVLYVGKAASLRERVSSYFHVSAKHAEHTLEMLSQAQGLRCTETGTALEAALLESDEIKRLEPPYNRALRKRERRLVFATPDLEAFSGTASAMHRLGPLPNSAVLPAVPTIRRLLAGEVAPPERALAMSKRWAPEPDALRAGLEMFRAALGASALLAHGARLWRRAQENGDSEEAFALEVERASRSPMRPESVASRLGDVVRRASHLVRRAHWHALASESTLAWRSREGGRVALVIEGGRVAGRRELEEGESPPPPPGAARSSAERRRSFELESYDRMTVLTKELRRLLAEDRDPVLTLGPGVALDAAQLERLLSWV